MRATSACPCGAGEVYVDCCGRFHAGASAPTAEALMRSRYSAFVVRDSAYLLRTWHPRTRPRRIDFDPRQRWIGLEIVDRRDGGLFDQTAIVEFRAHYEVGRTPGMVHERSQFTRHDNAWVYLGEQNGSGSTPIGRSV